MLILNLLKLPRACCTKIPNPRWSNKIQVNVVPSYFSTSNCSKKDKKMDTKQFYTEPGGIKIYYKKVGNGPIPVLCLPGTLGRIHADFGPQLKYLNKEKFTVVGWDPPGYGNSRPPDRNFNVVEALYQDARLAHAMMKELQFERFSILGWSEGGRAAMIMAALFPEAVEKLVVWGGSAFVTQDDVDRYEKFRDIKTHAPEMYDQAIKAHGEEYFIRATNAWLDSYHKLCAEGGNICKEHLSKIKCSTLILHGLKDHLVPKARSEYLHEQIQNSELFLFPEGGHNLHLMFYEKFNNLVEQFLTRGTTGQST